MKSLTQKQKRDKYFTDLGNDIRSTPEGKSFLQESFFKHFGKPDEMKHEQRICDLKYELAKTCKAANEMSHEILLELSGHHGMDYIRFLELQDSIRTIIAKYTNNEYPGFCRTERDSLLESGKWVEIQSNYCKRQKISRGVKDGN